MRKFLAVGLVSLIGLTGCSGPGDPDGTGVANPPDAGLAELRQEAVLENVPAGVEAEEPVEIPADGDLVAINAITRRSVAGDDASLAAAATVMYQAALADGWTGPDFEDPGSSGVFGTTLTKGEMTLDISYRTSASFDLLANDEDVLALDLRMETGSTGE